MPLSLAAATCRRCQVLSTIVEALLGLVEATNFTVTRQGLSIQARKSARALAAAHFSPPAPRPTTSAGRWALMSSPPPPPPPPQSAATTTTTRTQSMDPGHVSVAHVHLACAVFSHYRCDSDLVLGARRLLSRGVGVGGRDVTIFVLNTRVVGVWGARGAGALARRALRCLPLSRRRQRPPLLLMWPPSDRRQPQEPVQIPEAHRCAPAADRFLHAAAPPAAATRSTLNGCAARLPPFY
jgi:hypothetical protein